MPENNPTIQWQEEMHKGGLFQYIIFDFVVFQTLECCF